jgi:hypothetical protein
MLRYAILSSVYKLYNENCIRHWILAGNKQIGLKIFLQNHSIVQIFFHARSINRMLSIPEHYMKKGNQKGIKCKFVYESASSNLACK